MRRYGFSPLTFLCKIKLREAITKQQLCFSPLTFLCKIKLLVSVPGSMLSFSPLTFLCKIKLIIGVTSKYNCFSPLTFLCNYYFMTWYNTKTLIKYIYGKEWKEYLSFFFIFKNRGWILFHENQLLSKNQIKYH